MRRTTIEVLLILGFIFLLRENWARRIENEQLRYEFRNMQIYLEELEDASTRLFAYTDFRDNPFALRGCVPRGASAAAIRAVHGRRP